MKYQITEIAEITGGRIIRQGHVSFITHLCIDSRKIFLPAESLFFAIPGKNHNGHQFMLDAYRSGVRAFICEHVPQAELPSDTSVITVEKTVEALQKLAAFHRSRFHYPVVGITGSNGKTIVKEWLNVMLAEDYSIVRNPRSYNSQVGVPLSVWNMDDTHSLGLFEAGISLPGEMHNLQQIINPIVGIFLNIGNAHLENFSSKQEIANEKIKLFSACPVIITSSDYDEINIALKSLSHDPQIVSWSLKRDADLTLRKKTSASGVTILDCTWRGADCRFEIHFTDDASIENALACITYLLYLGYSNERIGQLLQRLTPIAMRLEVIAGAGDATIVNDVYNSDIHSLEIALDFLGQQSHSKKQVVILSDIEQSGWSNDKLHHRINELIVSKGIGKLIAIGRGMSGFICASGVDYMYYPDTESCLEDLNPSAFAGSAILVKGARQFRFERIVSALQEQSHDTVLEINLNALAHNLNHFRSKLKPGVKMMVMVKAFGYGSGAREVAGLLEFNKIDYLAVAYVDEGVALREAGISLPIMVMNPEHTALDTMIRYRLEPEIYSFRMLNNFLEVLERSGHRISYPVHIKFDTGMHRLGFDPKEASELGVVLSKRSSVKVVSAFTHLAAADEPEHDSFTELQLSKFEQATAELEQHLGYSFMRHTSNTAAIQRFPAAQYDMVRLGIGLYGVAAYPDEQKQLMPVGRLKTVISQIKNIGIGESVGYGRSFRADKPLTIATIPLGYADGLRRSLSNGVGEVEIAGKRCPIVGRVCMDMMMIDITGVNAKEGDEVIIFGSSISLIELAQKSGTIAYEILTSISSRVKRVYLSE